MSWKKYELSFKLNLKIWLEFYESDADFIPALKYRNEFKGISMMWLWC